ncbi:MAG: hypothetical protein KY452_13005, partial [Actinobacteria bacterium]|nr:hypothetical protein [Actinomycetota bacterium]
LRRVPAAPESRSRRAAVLGLLLVPNAVVVHYSVDWWNTLHQDATVSTLDPKIDDLMLFTLFLMFWAILVIIGSFFRGPGFNFTFPWVDGVFFDL